MRLYEDCEHFDTCKKNIQGECIGCNILRDYLLKLEEDGQHYCSESDLIQYLEVTI